MNALYDLQLAEQEMYNENLRFRIFNIDDRIKGVIAEIIPYCYYCKIEFKYILNNKENISLGKQEFMSQDETGLIAQIKTFFKEQHNFVIV